MKDDEPYEEVDMAFESRRREERRLMMEDWKQGAHPLALSQVAREEYEAIKWENVR